MPVALRGRSERIPLDVPIFKLGRALTNHLVLDELNASAFHAVLQQQGEHYSITDLGSSSGTYLNGQRLEANVPTLLRNGDAIRIGATVYTYEESPSSISRSPRAREGSCVSPSGEAPQLQAPDTLQNGLAPGNSRAAQTVPTPASAGSAESSLPLQGEPGTSGISRRDVLIGLAIVGAVVVGGSALSVAFKPSHIRPKPASTLFSYAGHSAEVNAVAWSPDGKLVASASFDGTVQLWEPLTGKCSLVYRGHSGVVQDVVWSPNGKVLASVGSDQMVRIWDAMTGKTLLSSQGHTSMNTVVWSPDGTRLATVSDEIQIWEAATGKLLQAFQSTGPNSMLSDALAWSPDGRLLASSPTSELVVYLYNTQTWGQTAVCSGHFGIVSSVAWARDGHALASGGIDQTVQVWDRAGKPLSVYRGHQDVVNAVAWSPSGERIASASGYNPVGKKDNAVHISEAATARQVYIYTGHSAPVTSVSWSPDGKLLASGSDDTTVQVWKAP